MSGHLKVCSGCAQSLPETQYSGAQLKKKGKRRCKACCGATNTTGGAGGNAAAASAAPAAFCSASDSSSDDDDDDPPPPPPPRTRLADAVAWEQFCVAHGLSRSSAMPPIPADGPNGDHDATLARAFAAALSEAYFSASARPPEVASAAMAASVYYGQRHAKSNQPHGEGLRLNDQGDIVDCQCGTWQAGQLVRQGAIMRASLPDDTPLREHARSCERIHPDGSAFVWLDRSKGLGTLFNADGSERRGGLWNTDTIGASKQEGAGFCVYPNGDRYTGSFANDKRHGAGSITNAAGDTVFVGQFTAGDRSTGISRTKVWGGGGEDVFEGSFQRDRPFQGVYRFANGCVSQGTFRCSATEARLEGCGIMVAPRVAPQPNAAPVTSTREATSAQNSSNNGAGSAAIAASSSPAATASSPSSSAATAASKLPSDFWSSRRFPGASSCDDGDSESGGGVLYDGQFANGLRQGWGVEWDGQGRVTQCGLWEQDQLSESKPVPIQNKLFSCIQTQGASANDLGLEELEVLAAATSPANKPLYCFLSTLARGSTLLYPCGAFFRGSLDQAGLPSGIGSKYNADSSLRERGFYVSGMLRGTHGECFTKGTRDRYLGDFKAGKPHGCGEMKYTNGDRYVGEWIRGFRVGKGTMHYAAPAAAANPSTSSVSSSSPQKGDVYSGMWRDDRSGLGVLTRGSDGSVHEGEFAAGRRNGLGMEWDAQGRLIRCGMWSHDVFLHSSPVPRHIITQGTFLNEQERDAQFLFPDGRYFCGVLPSFSHPSGYGTLYDKQHRALSVGPCGSTFSDTRES